MSKSHTAESYAPTGNQAVLLPRSNEALPQSSKFMPVIKQTLCSNGANVSETLKLLRILWDRPSSKRASWSLERRQQQALRCRQVQPWTKSTGPRTEVGKARSSLNSQSNRNKRDAKNFDIVAALVMEIERLKQENRELLKAKESYELRSEVTSSKTNPMTDHQQKAEKQDRLLHS